MVTGKIKSMQEFYQKYLPIYIKKYPIEMQVSKEEAEYLRWRRGEVWEMPNKGVTNG